MMFDIARIPNNENGMNTTTNITYPPYLPDPWSDETIAMMAITKAKKAKVNMARVQVAICSRCYPVLIRSKDRLGNRARLAKSHCIYR